MELKNTQAQRVKNKRVKLSQKQKFVGQHFHSKNTHVKVIEK